MDIPLKMNAGTEIKMKIANRSNTIYCFSNENKKCVVIHVIQFVIPLLCYYDIMMMMMMSHSHEATEVLTNVYGMY